MDNIEGALRKTGFVTPQRNCIKLPGTRWRTLPHLDNTRPAADGSALPATACPLFPPYFYRKTDRLLVKLMPFRVDLQVALQLLGKNYRRSRICKSSILV